MKSKKIEGSFDPETGEVYEPKLPRVKTHLNAKQYPKSHEVNGQPSKTVPGQTMSVLDMIKRHRMGLPIDESKGALYQGDELLPNLDHMDLVDRQAYMDSVADALVEIKSKLQEEAKTNREKEFLAKVDVAVREQLSKLYPKTPDESETKKQ